VSCLHRCSVHRCSVHRCCSSMSACVDS
jgi:hypothetical protein